MAVLPSVLGRRCRGRALRIAVAVGCALAAAAAGPGTAGAAVASPAAKWAGPYTIPDSATSSNPALASYQGQLYAAWSAGSSSPYQISYSAFDSATHMWSTPLAVPFAEPGADTGPALAVYHDDLYVAWEVQSSGSSMQMWYSAFNGTSWTTPVEGPSGLTTANDTGSVGLAVYGGDLYLAWVGKNVAGLWDSAFNGTSWTPQAKIPGTTDICNLLSASVALATYHHLLYMAWQACDSGTKPLELAYATFNGTSWSSPADGGPWPNTGPALAVKGTRLYASWSVSPAGVDWASFDGTTWTSPKTIPDSLGDGLAPAIAAYGGALYDAWTNGPIDYSERV